MNDSQSSITMMDLPMAQKKMIFRDFIINCLLVELLSSISNEKPQDIMIAISERVEKRMRIATNEKVNTHIEYLLKIDEFLRQK